MSALRVLITNCTLAGRTGTETYVRDLAIGLLRRGHRPIVYTTDRGVMSDEIERAAVPVVDDLAKLSTPPDVVHGHHLIETLTASLQFPETSIVAFCHDWNAWHDAALPSRRIRRWVAVDEACRDRLAEREGVGPERIVVLPNAVDLERFPARGPLPAQPTRAALFVNAEAAGLLMPILGQACSERGIALDRLGGPNPTSDPGAALAAYDVVFARGRSALEAAAVGAAVVTCGTEGFGTLATSAEWERFRRDNFGRRTLRRPVTLDAVRRELNRYDPADAAEVTRLARSEATLDSLLDQLESLYREVLAEPAPALDWRAESRIAADTLRRLMPYHREIVAQQRQIANLARHAELAGDVHALAIANLVAENQALEGKQSLARRTMKRLASLGPVGRWLRRTA